MISRHQIAAARVLLEWTQDELSKASGVTKSMISAIEKGSSAGSLKSLQSIETALELAGIEFSDNDGVCRAATRIQMLEGVKGCLAFYDDVFDEVRKQGVHNVFVSNVDEREFVKWQGEQLKEHSERMQALDVHYKILVKHGDAYFPAADYGEYRWMPEELFNSVPLYIYGRKLAMLVFADENLRIYILDEPEITKIHKKQFDGIWSVAEKPEAADA